MRRAPGGCQSATNRFWQWRSTLTGHRQRSVGWRKWRWSTTVPAMSTHDANLYEISRLLYDLRNPANREAVRADPQAYFARYAIGERGTHLLTNRDWQGLVDAGVTVYLLTKLGAALGVSLLEM